MPLSLDDEIRINQFSQSLHTIEEMQQWFLEKDLNQKRDVLFGLLNMVIQAHPTYDEIESATKAINKASSPSAVKLLNRNKPYHKFGYEICDLPESELVVGYTILLLTLATADNRRKAAEEPSQCHHWWHKDLSDRAYLRKLKKQMHG